jgi:hypothetical protein
MMADQPHPELGAGLFCLLNMPHLVFNQEKLNQAVAELNKLEMHGNDLPPHFGAWCPGKHNNIAYVSFLPDALHDINGIALNMSFWAMYRAHIADAMLRTMGIQLGEPATSTG